MKVLHIVAGELTGGAARGAYWLHEGLLEVGIDSKIFTDSKINYDEEHIVTVNQSKKERVFTKARREADKLFTLFYKNRKRVIFSTGFLGVDFTKTKEYKEADIIHLHWINGGFVNIKHLSKVDKPIIWTIRDMWAFTGGCHYSLGCEQYKIGCGSCEQLNSKMRYDLSKLVLNRKRKYIPKAVKIIGISTWLSEEARNSRLFNKFDIQTISNNINTKEFFPIDKEVSKNILGLKTDKKIVLVGATSLKDFYKGFDKFLDAVKYLDKDKYLICFFGNIDKKTLKDLNLSYKSFGFLQDAISLRMLYSSADVFVAPSIMEAFGKTIAESMACGTPVVCFDATGPKDIVTHQVDGYLVEPFEPSDLAKGIEWILNAPNYVELCKNAREKVLKEFDSVVVAKKYIELYQGVLNEK